MLHTLDVDGEVFAVWGHDDGTDYDWLSGPNPGYGFGTSGKNMPEEWHREQIRGFLAMIDPANGYMAED
ncbi:MAG: hypothetical protein H0V92_06060 [Pseudonocardiales bacterium]|nr:hypothetical protein [Pseudonocardiales bacterium]